MNDDQFFEWWNGDDLTPNNDFPKDSPIWWAWEGWQAANRQPWVKTYSNWKPNYTQPCERCGEVNPAEIHTCTPKREWVGLTDKEIEDCLEMSIHGTCRAVEAKLKEKNSTSEKIIQISDSND